MAYYATYMPNENGELQKVVINAGVGFVLPYYGETAPPGTLACDGSEISRAAYDELFAVLGTKAGAGNGSTTFNLPDLRGQFVRGTGGNAAELGAEQNDAIRNIEGIITAYESWGTNGVLNPVLDSAYTSNVFEKIASGTNRRAVLNDLGDPASNYGLHFDASRAVPTAAENRPVNVALLWCIIYE